MAYTPGDGDSADFNFDQGGYSPPDSGAANLQSSPGPTLASVTFASSSGMQVQAGLTQISSVSFQSSGNFAVTPSLGVFFKSSQNLTLEASRLLSTAFVVQSSSTVIMSAVVVKSLNANLGARGYQSFAETRALGSEARGLAEAPVSATPRQKTDRLVGGGTKGLAALSIGSRGFVSFLEQRGFGAQTQIAFDTQKSLGSSARNPTDVGLSARAFAELYEEYKLGAQGRQSTEDKSLGGSTRGLQEQAVGTRAFEELNASKTLGAEAAIFSQNNIFYRMISRSLHETVMDSEDADVLVGLMVSLQQQAYERIKEFPKLRDLDRMPDNLVPHLQREVATRLPHTDLIDKREFVREAKNWYSGKGAAASYDYISALTKTKIVIQEPARSLMRLDRPSTALSGSLNSEISTTGTKLGIMRDGDKWAFYTYILRIFGVQDVSVEDLIELLELVHPAGTKYFLEFVYQHLVQELSYTKEALINDKITDYYTVKMPTTDLNGLSNRFRLSSEDGTLDLGLSAVGAQLIPVTRSHSLVERVFVTEILSTAAMRDYALIDILARCSTDAMVLDGACLLDRGIRFQSVITVERLHGEVAAAAQSFEIEHRHTDHYGPINRQYRTDDNLTTDGIGGVDSFMTVMADFVLIP